MDDHSNEHEADDIMGQVRALGPYPKRKRTGGGEEDRPLGAETGLGDQSRENHSGADCGAGAAQPG